MGKSAPLEGTEGSNKTTTYNCRTLVSIITFRGKDGKVEPKMKQQDLTQMKGEKPGSLSAFRLIDLCAIADIRQETQVQISLFFFFLRIQVRLINGDALLDETVRLVFSTFAIVTCDAVSPMFMEEELILEQVKTEWRIR